MYDHCDVGGLHCCYGCGGVGPARHGPHIGIPHGFMGCLQGLRRAASASPADVLTDAFCVPVAAAIQMSGRLEASDRTGKRGPRRTLAKGEAPALDSLVPALRGTQFSTDVWRHVGLAVARAGKPNQAPRKPATGVQYFDDSCEFTGYTVPVHMSHALDPLEVDPDGRPTVCGRLFDFLGYLLWYTRPKTGRTLRRYLGHVCKYWGQVRSWRYVVSSVTADVIHRWGQLPVERRFRIPATKQLIKRVMDDSSIDLAVRTAIIVAFNAALRCSEYLAQSRTAYDPKFCLQRRDVAFDRTMSRSAAAIFLRQSKTDHTNSGQWAWLPSTSDTHYCASDWLRRHLEATCHSSTHPGTGPLFVRHCGGFVTRADITEALRKHGQACGLDTERLSCYSLRIGSLFEMCNAGVPMETIASVARWAASSAPSMSLLYCRMNLARRATAADALTLSDAPASNYLYNPLVPK